MGIYFIIQGEVEILSKKPNSVDIFLILSIKVLNYKKNYYFFKGLRNFWWGIIFY